MSVMSVEVDSYVKTGRQLRLNRRSGHTGHKRQRL
jgi:hypothetical protein